ncbi:hypothetical protein KK062_16195 [Fulvivirgaceae bacterium PWU5]|uniref:Uncharacterized protein n=1 Tax=Dawidia cretensis TaxID=2782350 RepID=A0AAP2DYQ6_9BACT|nr:hypothetical protein [Dawidia cretensis]MBT1709786.1 hypothetical protein [Dawidia cretensis]
MDEKISLEAIALYGDMYADAVLKGFFASRDKITGPDILKLCNVHQVNLFVIRELLRSWKDEAKKLKSPYFDYEHPDVREALDNFMGTLSQQISIDRQHFAPLLKKASSQALMAIFDPYDFYVMILTGKNNKLEVASFRDEIKYMKVNKAPLDRMLLRMEQRNMTELAGNEAFAVLDEILEEVNFTPEDVDDYIEQFSAVVPLDPASFYVSTAPVVPPVRQAPPPPPPAEVRRPTPPPPPVSTPPVSTPPVSQAPPQPKQHNTMRPPAPTGAAASLNEKHSRESRSSLGNNLHKISRIKDSLTINQKFMFTKVLFHGDFELFSKAIDRLDQLDTIQSALRYIEEEHASTWDRDSEEFHEFMELVEKRFI